MMPSAPRARNSLRKPENRNGDDTPPLQEFRKTIGALKVRARCPDGLVISVLRDGNSWEFRASADDATVAKPGYPECVAMMVQIGDHLSRQYDFKE